MPNVPDTYTMPFFLRYFTGVPAAGAFILTANGVPIISSHPVSSNLPFNLLVGELICYINTHTNRYNVHKNLQVSLC